MGSFIDPANEQRERIYEELDDLSEKIADMHGRLVRHPVGMIVQGGVDGIMASLTLETMLHTLVCSVFPPYAEEPELLRVIEGRRPTSMPYLQFQIDLQKNLLGSLTDVFIQFERDRPAVVAEMVKRGIAVPGDDRLVVPKGKATMKATGNATADAPAE